MIVAAIPGDVYTIAAALFLLVGVPAILFGIIMLYTGYVRYDAEQYLEELETAETADSCLEEPTDEQLEETTEPDDR